MRWRLKGVYVSDLADQAKDKARAGEVLYCPTCGIESSASQAEYLYFGPDFKLRCYCRDDWGGKPTDLLLVCDALTAIRIIFLGKVGR